MTEVLEAHPELTKQFVYQWLEEGNIKTSKWQDMLYEYIADNYTGKALVEKTMEGITLREMGNVTEHSLQDMIAPADDLIIDPMPNLYFTRDLITSVGNGIFLHKMRFPTRRRESIYGEYIFRYHPDYNGDIFLPSRVRNLNLQSSVEQTCVISENEIPKVRNVEGNKENIRVGKPTLFFVV
jgi:arginine deiminase